MFIPRGVGDPRRFGPPSHKAIVRYGQRADELGFDSLWVPDHFFIERPQGVLTPYPEAWTTMTALALSTKRARGGSLVLAAWFRHRALPAKLAGLRQACRKIGRDPDELEISSFTTAIVSPDERQAAEVVASLRDINGGISAEQVRQRYVLGTPDQVVAGLRRLVDWGVNHLI